MTDWTTWWIVVSGAFAAGLIGRALWAVFGPQKAEAPADTQDDFDVSARRWADLRDGGHD